MNGVLARAAAAVVRGWTYLYTCRLPAALADERRREVESDLWELQSDPESGRGVGVASQLLGRLLLGAPDDLVWRFEHVAVDVAARQVLATAVVVALLVAALWTGQAPTSEGARLASSPVDECARAAGRPKNIVEFRLRVMDCAGQFFVSRRISAPLAEGR
jgi:hypothetical protein